MKLVADAKGRLTAVNLFPPNAAFDATPRPDGSIRIVRLKECEVPIVHPRMIDGRIMGADIQLSRDIAAAAVRADRDER